MNEKRLIFCPICGRHVMKSGGCKDTTIPCPKCGSELMFSVDSNSVSIQVVKMSTKQKKPRVDNYIGRSSKSAEPGFVPGRAPC